MPLPVVLLLVVAAAAASVALVVTVVQLVRRLAQLVHDLDGLQRELTPALERLQRDGEVTGAELGRVGDQLDRLRASRAARRRLLGRPRR